MCTHSLCRITLVWLCHVFYVCFHLWWSSWKSPRISLWSASLHLVLLSSQQVMLSACPSMWAVLSYRLSANSSKLESIICLKRFVLIILNMLFPPCIVTLVGLLALYHLPNLLSSPHVTPLDLNFLAVWCNLHPVLCWASPFSWSKNCNISPHTVPNLVSGTVWIHRLFPVQLVSHRVHVLYPALPLQAVFPLYLRLHISPPPI